MPEEISGTRVVQEIGDTQDGTTVIGVDCDTADNVQVVQTVGDVAPGAVVIGVKARRIGQQRCAWRES